MVGNTDRENLERRLQLDKQKGGVKESEGGKGRGGGVTFFFRFCGSDKRGRDRKTDRHR